MAQNPDTNGRDVPKLMNGVVGRGDGGAHVTYEVFLSQSHLNQGSENWKLVILICTSRCEFVFPSGEGLEMSSDCTT